jgi:hypothetical protein
VVLVVGVVVWLCGGVVIFGFGRVFVDGGAEVLVHGFAVGEVFPSHLGGFVLGQAVGVVGWRWVVHLWWHRKIVAVGESGEGADVDGPGEVAFAEQLQALGPE